MLVALTLFAFSGKASAETVEETLEIAREFGNAGLHDQAIELLVPIAVGGDQRAQALLGSIYVAKQNENDYMRGHSWVARAAMQGEPDAFILLWSTLSLRPELNNYNPHGEELGQLLREQYTHSLLFIISETTGNLMFENILADRRDPSDWRVTLTPEQIQEAERIATECIESDFADCPPLEVFIRR